MAVTPVQSVTSRYRLYVTAICFVVSPLLRPMAAQEDERGVSALPQFELRPDVTFARAEGAHLGVGVNLRAGYYVRVGAALAAGAIRGGDDVWRGAPRLDVTARFLLDPFGERPRGLYGGAGVSVQHVAGGNATGTLLLLAGIEGRQRRTFTPAIEVGVGGGVRLGVVFRRTRRGQAR